MICHKLNQLVTKGYSMQQQKSSFFTLSRLCNGFSRQSQQLSNAEQQTFIIRPILFTVGLAGSSFVGCTILQYERAKKQLNQDSVLQRFSHGSHEKTFQFRNMVNQWWNNLHEGHKVASGIIGINMFIFALWQVPANQRFMMRWFISVPTVKRTSPLLLSCFSHSESWHIAANMFVFWSFAPLIQSLLGTEQFIAFYLTGGTVSSLVSHCFKITTKSGIPSLGASGALLAVLAACCIERPDARLSILFLPFFTFSAKTGLYSIIAVDVCGVIFRWKLFDHAAHLGGTLFGIFYMCYSQKWTWNKRASFIRWWHEQRKKLKWN